MIIEFEINGARVIVSGDNLTVNITQDGKPIESTPVGVFKVAGHPVSPVQKMPSPEKIKALRKSMKFNQARFAKLFGVAQATVCRWEIGSDKPSGPAAILLLSMMNAETAA